MEASTYWGYHLLLDCSGCNVELIKDKDNIKKFVKELVNAIEMTPIGDPWIERTAIGIADKEGFSMYQLIVTSNISAHFIDSVRHVYLDVFSCKKFDQNTVMYYVEKYFKATKIRSNFITRNAD